MFLFLTFIFQLPSTELKLAYAFFLHTACSPNGLAGQAWSRDTD